MGKYDKMTKVELITELEALEHVGSSIIEKDREYNNLKNSIDEKILEATKLLRDEIVSKNKKIKDLNDAFANSNNEHGKKLESIEDDKIKAESDHLDKISKLESEHRGDVLKQIQLATEPLQKEIENLTSFCDRRSKELSKVMANHGALLKSIQGIGDMAVALNEYMFEEFSRKEK